MGRKDYYNASGCADPTAYYAIERVRRDEAKREVDRLVKLIKSVAAANGFTIVNRVVLKDVESGRVYK